jgi:hypothetical protein
MCRKLMPSPSQTKKSIFPTPGSNTVADRTSNYDSKRRCALHVVYMRSSCDCQQVSTRTSVRLCCCMPATAIHDPGACAESCTPLAGVRGHTSVAQEQDACACLADQYLSPSPITAASSTSTVVKGGKSSASSPSPAASSAGANRARREVDQPIAARSSTTAQR